MPEDFLVRSSGQVNRPTNAPAWKKRFDAQEDRIARNREAEFQRAQARKEKREQQYQNQRDLLRTAQKTIDPDLNVQELNRLSVYPNYELTRKRTLPTGGEELISQRTLTPEQQDFIRKTTGDFTQASAEGLSYNDFITRQKAEAEAQATRDTQLGIARVPIDVTDKTAGGQVAVAEKETEAAKEVARIKAQQERDAADLAAKNAKADRAAEKERLGMTLTSKEKIALDARRQEVELTSLTQEYNVAMAQIQQQQAELARQDTEQARLDAQDLEKEKQEYAALKAELIVLLKADQRDEKRIASIREEMREILYGTEDIQTEDI